jgi:hypothetical protein
LGKRKTVKDWRDEIRGLREHITLQDIVLHDMAFGTPDVARLGYPLTASLLASETEDGQTIRATVYRPLGPNPIVTLTWAKRGDFGGLFEVLALDDFLASTWDYTSLLRYRVREAVHRC